MTDTSAQKSHRCFAKRVYTCQWCEDKRIGVEYILLELKHCSAQCLACPRCYKLFQGSCPKCWTRHPYIVQHETSRKHFYREIKTKKIKSDDPSLYDHKLQYLQKLRNSRRQRFETEVLRFRLWSIENDKKDMNYFS